MFPSVLGRISVLTTSFKTSVCTLGSWFLLSSSWYGRCVSAEVRRFCPLVVVFCKTNGEERKQIAVSRLNITLICNNSLPLCCCLRVSYRNVCFDLSHPIPPSTIPSLSPQPFSFLISYACFKSLPSSFMCQGAGLSSITKLASQGSHLWPDENWLRTTPHQLPRVL